MASLSRNDKGGENVDIGRYMIEQHHGDESAFLRGPSPHNQRIERWLQDVNRVVGHFFRSVFVTLENSGVLDINSEQDLTVLHYVY